MCYETEGIIVIAKQEPSKDSDALKLQVGKTASSM